jgi:hypothetical protein
MRYRILLIGSLIPAAMALGCQPFPDDPLALLEEGEDLPLGEMSDTKTDGNWGHALTCKDIPVREALADPRITISVDGMTIHLQDQATGFSKVYPIGVGEINPRSGQVSSGESLTLYPVLRTKKNDFTIKTATINSCRKWWTDPSSGKRIPVFAGLPFIRFYGAFGIHGPISRYTEKNGGALKRGYVSHGCVRMEALDVAELWAYIKDTSEVPVRVQKAVERRVDGSAVDIPQKWILSECQSDSDCNFEGGICKASPASGRSFCTAACSQYCDYDKYGYPETFCIEDHDNSAAGYCTYKSNAFHNSCRRFDHFRQAKRVSRFGQPTKKATVCKPGSQGWVGDLCLENNDCKSGLRCQLDTNEPMGFCTQSCSLYCPDLVGHAKTFCSEGLCRARCDLNDNNASCAAGFNCSEEPRFNAPEVLVPACMPGADLVTPLPAAKEFSTIGAVPQDGEDHYVVDVGTDAQNIDVQLTGENDADLYTHFGSAPTEQTYACRPYYSDSVENCAFTTATSDQLFIMVRGWAPSSAYQLKVTWN